MTILYNIAKPNAKAMMHIQRSGVKLSKKPNKLYSYVCVLDVMMLTPDHNKGGVKEYCLYKETSTSIAPTNISHLNCCELLNPNLISLAKGVYCKHFKV